MTFPTILSFYYEDIRHYDRFLTGLSQYPRKIFQKVLTTPRGAAILTSPRRRASVERTGIVAPVPSYQTTHTHGIRILFVRAL